MSEKRISLGINVSIIVTLTIFGVLLSLPLRLLLDTSYYSRNETIGENSTVNATDNTTIEAIPVDHKRLKLCPRFDYEDNLKSVYRSDYDRNCTYAVFENDDSERNNKSDKYEDDKEDDDDTSEILKEINGENTTENVEESGKDRQSKSALVAGHILVTMLLISAIAALVEVLRIRFARDKDSSKAGSASSRKTSTIEFHVQRKFLDTPRYPMKSQRSFEMHRSALRLLGARPPPLIRRSSFPTQQSKQSSGSVGGTPNNRISRRQSTESDEKLGCLINTLHHHARLIRRH